MLQFSNILLKHTGYYMYNQIENSESLHFAHTVHLCAVQLSA